MASPQESQKVASRSFKKMYDFDPDVDTAVDVAWVDMQNYRTFQVGFFRTIGTGNLDGFRILANSSPTGAGTDVVVKVHAIASQPNAVGDQIWLECQAEEVMQEANDAGVTGARYVSASLEFATSTDEGVVLYELGSPRFAYDHLTADIVA